MRKRLLVLCTVVPVVVAALIAVVAASAAAPAATATVHAKWVTGLGLGLSAGSGSTVGPDGALYANDPVNGRVVRVDAATGAASVYADCLPKRLVPFFGFSGGMDVAFIGHTAYALVTVVSDPLLGEPMRTGSTASTERITAASSPTSARGRWRICRTVAASTTSYRRGCSTRWSRGEAGFSSPTGITTACSASASTDRSRS